MRSIVLIIFISAIVIPARGQEPVTDSAQSLTEVVVSANKFAEKSRHVAQKVTVISSREIASSLSNNTAGLLEQTGKIFVQRSQLGGGSPVINGFEASRILLVVDGVRMNNAIYRTGHLQNAITIDDDILERTEILYGPSSTIYGSDALGGVIHFQTRQPRLSREGFRAQTNASTRYSSAFAEFSGHVDVNLGWKKFASLTSVSYSSFGDLRQGADRNPFYGDFGKRTAYIARINGMDSIVANKNVNIQKFSNYKQYDFLQKLRWEPGATQSHELNLQYSTSSDIPRYDRLTDTRNGQLRWAEWYYGPQDRLMAAYTYKRRQLPGFFDQLMAGMSYQRIVESRMQRAYRKDLRENRIEHIDVAAFHIDLRKSAGRHELSTGADGQLNYLNSTAYNYNIANGQKTYGLQTRYPDGKNNMSYAGAYLQHLYKIIPGKLILNDGIRVNYVALNAHIADPSLLHLPFTDASQRNFTYSLNAGIIYLPDPVTKLSFNFSTGFRAPNIDDLAKVFESAGGIQLVVPNADLQPEKTYQFNLNLERQFDEWVTLEANAFYTFFRDAIVLDNFHLNGASSIEYDGRITPVVANQNKARAFIYGLQGSVTLRPVSHFSLYSHAAYTYGRYKGSDGQQVPMDHIPPVFGKTGITYTWRFVESECALLYNGWKKLKDYNPSGEDNLPYATAAGMPSWSIFNASVACTIGRHLQVQVTLENILDRNYRVFSSGISGAGRNLMIRLKALQL
ncbi:TonB-dependent receptor [Pseudoflavitalea sp. X16]|uniref:TonB-dependent receptor plug domain-containing protein n=1 Tax=Paraflavitalea devenefica TaxID=2716334 RepID=UPI00141F2F10|nr:TonB-dependent receptor [Paraflavitalea devenefica]NII26446.1 TonB-dependent receptor [Paraflavitalea devenefica]